MVSIDTNLKLVGGEKIHELVENRFQDSSTASGTNWKAVGWHRLDAWSAEAKMLYFDAGGGVELWGSN